jgi:hypothetical protein
LARLFSSARGEVGIHLFPQQTLAEDRVQHLQQFAPATTSPAQSTDAPPARRKIAAWKIEYNEERPHGSLGYKTPKEFAAAQAAGFYTAEREARNSNGRCYETDWEIDDKDAKMAASEVVASWPTSKANNAVSTHCFQ